MKWIFLGGAILAEVTATLSLKAGLAHPGWYVLVTLGYCAAFFLMVKSLRRGLPLGVGYGIWGALGVACTALLGAAIFGEALTPTMLIGLGLVIAGVLVVQLGSQQVASKKEQSA